MSTRTTRLPLKEYLRQLDEGTLQPWNEPAEPRRKRPSGRPRKPRPDQPAEALFHCFARHETLVATARDTVRCTRCGATARRVQDLDR